MGFRVPALICSPFSRGGLVCSSMFDHTSLLRFLELRFGIEMPNITEWRRKTAGDLTDAFNFAAAPDASVPALPPTDLTGGVVTNPNCALTAVGSAVVVGGGSRYTLTGNAMPGQEPGAPRRPSGIPRPSAPAKKRKKRRRRRHKGHHHRRRHRRRHRKIP
jgi:phospholipase C